MDNEKKEPNWQKRQLILALVTTALLAVVLGTLAWLHYSRALQTITEVHVPSLWLEGPNGQNISTVDLGEIDVEDGTFSRQYVFAVASNEGNPYFLQLAHTTNIPFTYTIYQASIKEQSFVTGASVSGEYKNLQDGSDKLAGNKYHVATYGSYKNVQKNAEPLYWKSAQQVFSQTQKPYISYYVLEVRWGNETEGTNVHNTKETDLIYLMAITDGTTQSGQ